MKVSVVTRGILAAIMTLCLTHTAYGYNRITMGDLGTLGGYESKAVAVNRYGHVIGDSTTSNGETHAFLYRYGYMIDLYTLGGEYSTAIAVNAADQVVGESRTASGAIHAFIWDRGMMIDLGTLEGEDGYSSAYAINNNGDVVGASTTPSGATHAVLWRNGKIIDLGTLKGGPDSYAFDINDNGQIVGYSERGDYFEHAFLWQKYTMKDLGAPPDNATPITRGTKINRIGTVMADVDGLMDPFGGIWKAGVWTRIFSGNMTTYAQDINDKDEVVGCGDFILSRHGWLWRSGKLIDLKALNGGNEESHYTTEPKDINNRGQIVGFSTSPSGETHAFLWDSGMMFDIGPWSDHSVAQAINENGIIVGYALNAMLESHATMWKIWPNT